MKQIKKRVNLDHFLNSTYATKSYNFIDILVFSFGLFMLQYAMDVKWKTIGNEKMQLKFETDETRRKKMISIDLNPF